MTDFPSEQWSLSSPEAEGLDPLALEKALDRLRQGVGRNGVDRLVIIRNGRLVWCGPDAHRVHGVWSVTKSFTSTVLGLLVDRGRVKLDDPAALYYPDLAPHYGQLTLRHFATMTSGYRALDDEPQGTYVHGPSDQGWLPGPPLFAPPGSMYAYWDSAMNTFGYVLTQAAGEPLDELLRREVMRPIGLSDDAWSWGDFGNVGGLRLNCGSGNHDKHIRTNALSLARFGWLWLNRGQWNGRQILSESYIAEATRVQVPASLPVHEIIARIDGRGAYGLNWWVNGIRPDGRRFWPQAPASTFAAHGFNNNRCFVLPDWQMVIARLGLDGNVDGRIWEDFLADLAAAIN